jgi:hypothetical protein
VEAEERLDVRSAILGDDLAVAVAVKAIDHRAIEAGSGATGRLLMAGRRSYDTIRVRHRLRFCLDDGHCTEVVERARAAAVALPRARGAV